MKIYREKLYLTLVQENNVNVEHPQVLYKYRDWDNPKHRDVLNYCTLFLASPREFEDKKDCNVPEKYPTRQKEIFDYFFRDSKKNHPIWSRTEHRRFAKYWRKNSSMANPNELKQILKESKEEFYNRIGILSMTTNYNNDEMWKKYANENKGFCVGFDTNILFQYVGGGGHVYYEDMLPVIDFVKDDYVEQYLKNTFFKEQKWAFEQEYRLHKRWQQTATIEQRSLKLPKECIVVIILGKYMTENNKEEIKGIAKENYPNAKIIEL